MRYSTTFLDEVRDRVKLSALIGQYVIWDKRKTNASRLDYWGCCPFHGEKSPSFHVEDRKQTYHCFGCGAHGDAFRFLMEHAGRTFPEAVEELANMAGVPLPAQTPEAREAAVKRLTLVEANEKAAQWFQAQLATNPTAKDYAASRGLTAADLALFRIGYAPEGNALTQAHLGADDQMVEAGILGRSDQGGRLYDRFHGRLMFPIMDGKGKAIAFSGRDLTGKADAKYLNSPATSIFDKSNVLYNLHIAKPAAWDGAQLAVLEGQMDVIAATRAGLAAVSPQGTALTEQHVAQLQKISAEPVLCFDGDAAGRKAQGKAIDLIIPHVSPAFTARIAQMPDGEDPDSMVNRNPEQFVKLIGAALPLADALWKRETAAPIQKPEDRARLEGALRAALKPIKDRDTKRAYGIDFKARLDAMGRPPKLYRSNSYSQHSTSPGAIRLLGGFRHEAGFSLKEAILIGAIAAAPRAALDNAENLAADDRLSAEAITLIGELVLALSKSPEGAVREALDAAGLGEAVDDALARASGAGVTMEIGSEATAAISVLANAKRH